jgi:ribosomal protein S18 acetylase RimI-like enzyme
MAPPTVNVELRMNNLDAAAAVSCATADDADALAAISTGSISGKHAFIVDSLARRRVVAARLDGRIVGYIVWDRSFFSRPFVWLLGVDPAFRRRGIATNLLREFERRCRGESLFTSTNESNHPMQTLLCGLGYVPSGRIENIDPGDPELVYFKDTEHAASRPTL